MTSKHRITVGEELRYDADVQGLRGLSTTYVQQTAHRYPDGVTQATVVPRLVQLDVRDGTGVVMNTSTDSTSGVQQIIDSCAAAGGGEVVIPGFVKVSSLTLRAGVTIRGIGSTFGSGSTQSGIMGTAGADTITYPAGATEDTGLRNIAVIGGRRAVALVGRGATNIVFRDVTLSGSESGFYCDNTIERCTFSRVQFSGGQYGFRLVDNGTINNYMDKCSFEQVRCTGQSGNGFRVESYRACNANSIRDIVVNGCGGSPMFFAAGLSGFAVENYSSELVGTSGPALAITTGTIVASSTALTVASASNLAVSQQLTIAGAGLSGVDLVTTITAIAGTSVTLAAAAATSVSNAEVTNAVYDDWTFNTPSSGGAATGVVIIGSSLAAAGASDRLRYAIGGDLAVYPILVGSQWTRPLDDRLMRSVLIGCKGPVRQPSSLNNTALAYTQFNASGLGRKSVLPGVPGAGTVLALRGSGNNNENAAPYGNLQVVRTDANRSEVVRVEGDTGNLVVQNAFAQGNLIISYPGGNHGATNSIILGDGGAPTGNPTGGGVLFSQAGALKWRGPSGTVTTVAPA